MPNKPEPEDKGELQRDDLLSKYEQQDVSMFGLLKTLLSSSTMPHIILIISLSIIFYITARIDSLTVFSAMAFTSLSASYIITAMLVNNNRVKNWITLSDQDSPSNNRFLMRYLSPFRICLFPIISACIILVLLTTLTGENGIIANANKSIPLILGMLFIAWSIVQGTSFSQWASTTSAKRSKNAKKLGSLNTSVIFLLITVCFFSILSAFVFYQLEEINNSFTESVLASIPFAFLAVGLSLGSISYSWQHKKLTSMKSRLHKFSSTWSVICHLFITWHLLTIWRQNFMDPTIFQVFIEEIALMIFTVFVAIWSMTSKGYKSKFRLITEKNALTWGLAFGYAYAGSVAMLTTFFDDIKIVMSMGHAVVIITVIYVHKLVLGNVIEKDNTSVDVNRILEESKPLTSPGDNSIEVVQTNFESNTLAKSNTEEVWQEDDDVDWNKQKEQTQIDDIEWNETIDLD